MTVAIEINNVEKTYDNGFKALKKINLTINRGEIFALLGENGAGKTTLINCICGIVNFTNGNIKVFGKDNKSDYRDVRSLIGLVPQELTTDAFESVWNTVGFSRELFGKKHNAEFQSDLLKKLALFDKRDSQLRTLSGGMKRRVMIAKALSHEPEVLFLDEPTAGVDVELRKSMWQQVKALRETGVTIILTTHYIEEAEKMADRIGVIHNGEIIEVENKDKLLKKWGTKTLALKLNQPLDYLPEGFSDFDVKLSADKNTLSFHYSLFEADHSVGELLEKINSHNIAFKDIVTYESSLEEIYVNMVRNT